MIRVRRISPDDWQLFRELRLSALAEAPYAYGSTLSQWQGERDCEARWRQRLTDVLYNAVAFLDGTEAGIVSATAPNDEGETELISMWVAPFARGNGVGDGLVDAVVAWATNVGAACVVLRVRENNFAARRLYERDGFTSAGRIASLQEPPELRMIRPLCAENRS